MHRLDWAAEPPRVVSGPLFDGDTEPAPSSPQQCLVLQPLLSLCGLGILDHFSMAGGTQAKNIGRR